MSEITVFVDETGGFGFKDLNEETSIYIISAVAVKSVDLDYFKSEFDNILSLFPHDGLLKSSTLKKLFNGKDKTVVEKIIDSLINLDFITYSIILDKRNINQNSGLKYHSPYYKYLHKILYQKIIKYNYGINFLTDSYSNEKFQNNFIEYLTNSINSMELGMFNSFNVEYLHQDKYVQIADWVAGILRSRILNEDFGIFYEKISEKVVFNLSFPFGKIEKINDKIHQFNQDEIDFGITFNYNNLAKINDSNLKEIMQFLILNYWTNPRKYCYSAEILEYMNQIGINGITTDKIKMEFISKLRDMGFIIVSSNDGYKIPSCLEDWKNYAHKISNNFIPALKRLNQSISAYASFLNKPSKEIYSQLGEKGLYELVEHLNDSEIGLNNSNNYDDEQEDEI